MVHTPKTFIGYSLVSEPFFNNLLKEIDEELGYPNANSTILTYTWCREHPLEHSDYVLSYWKDDCPPVLLDKLCDEIERIWGEKKLFTYEELEPDGWFELLEGEAYEIDIVPNDNII